MRPHQVTSAGSAPPSPPHCAAARPRRYAAAGAAWWATEIATASVATPTRRPPRAPSLGKSSSPLGSVAWSCSNRPRLRVGYMYANAIACQIRSAISVRFQSNSSAIPVQFQRDSSAIPVQFQCNSSEILGQLPVNEIETRNSTTKVCNFSDRCIQIPTLVSSVAEM